MAFEKKENALKTAANAAKESSAAVAKKRRQAP